MAVPDRPPVLIWLAQMCVVLALAVGLIAGLALLIRFLLARLGG